MTQAKKPHENFLRLSQPSLVLSSHELEEVDKHCIVLDKFMQARAENFVLQRQDEPLIEQCMNDGTPYTTEQRHALWWDDFKVVREAKECKDFLMQRVFLSDTHQNVVPMFQEPKLMKLKTHLVSYNGLNTMWKGARALGALFVVITVGLFDRAVKSAMELRLRQRQATQNLFLCEEFPQRAAELVTLSWLVVLGCSIHDMHGALKWAVMLYMANKTLMKDAWVVLQSLRQSSQQIMRFLPGWVATVLKFEDWLGPNLEPLYKIFGICEKWLPLIVRMQIRWDGDVLKVACWLELDPECLKKVGGAHAPLGVPTLDRIQVVWRRRWQQTHDLRGVHRNQVLGVDHQC